MIYAVIFRIIMISQGIFWTAAAVCAYTSALVQSLMLMNGVIFTAAGIVKEAHLRRYRSLLYVFLTANAVLSLADQTGFLDYIALVLDIAAVLLLYLISGPCKRKLSG